jgi:NAD(P)-dependent dehydrogenase (short-subunit alcohol dehydrogenase family)
MKATFQEIRQHNDFRNLKLKVAIWHVKHSSKKPFLEETPEAFGESLQTYTTGAFTFAQESLRMIYDTNGGETLLKDTRGEKKGTIIFTGTLGAMRTNIGFGAYGAGRAGVRMIAQSLAKEVSEKGVHVVHAILNGGVKDEDTEETRIGQRMSAEAVGKTYLWLAHQEPSVWVHELDLRPALEKF